MQVDTTLLQVLSDKLQVYNLFIQDVLMAATLALRPLFFANLLKTSSFSIDRGLGSLSELARKLKNLC